MFAKTHSLARSKIIVATLFLSPSFLYLCRFLRIFVREDFCPGRARSGLVTSSRSFTLAPFFALTLSVKEYLFVSACVYFFILSPIRSCKS